MNIPVVERSLKINGFSLSLAFEGEEFLGIGEVRDGHTLLRSGALPWTLYCESENGVRFGRFCLLEVLREDNEATLVFESRGEWQPRIQDADAMGDARIRTRRLNSPRALFHWRFRGIEETIFENVWRGLAMQVEAQTPGHPIHWILEDATWEIGGVASGSTLIQQDVSMIDLEQKVEDTSAFSTIEQFGGADESGPWCGTFPMDMLPRAAGAAICDFAWKDNFALCLFAEQPGLTRARTEKFADEDMIHYSDRAFFPLSENVKAPERKLLVHRHAQELKQHEARNLWLDCFMEVRSRILGHYDFQVEIPRPSVTSHLWDDDLKQRGAAWSEPLLQSLSLLHEAGFKDIFTHGGWNGVTSDPNTQGNICHPYEFRFDENFGGDKSMKRLIQSARECDIGIFQWFGFQFAKESPVWKEHPEWLLREANGEPWDASYGSLWCGRMRSGFGEAIFQQIKELNESIGLRGIFWDSYQNLGVTCVDWQGADKAPQADEIWKFQAALQKLGFAQRCEVVTIFGVSQVGMFGMKSDTMRRRLWDICADGDHAFALLDTSPGFAHEPFNANELPPEKYFWLAAHRAVPIMDFHPWRNHGALPGGALAPDYARVNHLYNAALPHMIRPRLVEGGTHIVWLDAENRPALVWAFEAATMEFRGTARELASKQETHCEAVLQLAPMSVYLLLDN